MELYDIIHDTSYREFFTLEDCPGTYNPSCSFVRITIYKHIEFSNETTMDSHAFQIKICSNCGKSIIFCMDKAIRSVPRWGETVMDCVYHNKGKLWYQVMFLGKMMWHPGFFYIENNIVKYIYINFGKYYMLHRNPFTWQVMFIEIPFDTLAPKMKL